MFELECDTILPEHKDNVGINVQPFPALDHKGCRPDYPELPSPTEHLQYESFPELGAR